ncbi:MAG: hypothetical protein IT484_01005 [Gammaproteobacteria bacterium]|nr:hypothetical protein [Gammaproteobacteria bacterium]
MGGAYHDIRCLRRASAAGLALWLAVPLALAMEPAAAPAPEAAPEAAAGQRETRTDTTPATAEPAGAGQAPDPRPDEAGQPGTSPCAQPGADGQPMLDRMQRGVYLGVCGTVRWFDGLFGTRRYDQDSDATYGRLGLTEFWDDRNDLRTRVRLRARITLPTAKQRMKLLFGRVDDQEVERDSHLDTGPQLPGSFRRVENESWLLGLGYSKQGDLKNGFDFGAGIKIRTPPDPYVKGTYRHNLVFGEDITLRARQTLFWRDKRGFGETTEVSLDKLLGERLLLRWDNGATVAEDVRRLEWYSGLILFQSLGDRRGLSWTGFVSGVANTDVPLRNYGVELRYRARVLRKWLFLEGRSSLTWPRETLAEERGINPGVGLGFEMYFGPVPDSQLR